MLGLNSKKKFSTISSNTTKKSKKINFVFLALITTTAATVMLIYQFFIIDIIKADVKQQTIKEVTTKDSEYVQVITLKNNLDKGATIDVDKDLDIVYRDSKIIPKDYIKDKNLLRDLSTRIKLTAGTVLSSEMVIRMEEIITDDIKDQDFDYVKLHAFLKVGDYIDIHYKRKDGSDDIVVSKKKVKELNGGKISFNYSEEERAYLNNATVAAAISGGTIYTSIYPDPENQEAAKVTYKLNDEVKKMIENNPNIIKESANTIKNKEAGTSNSSTATTSTTKDTEDTGSKKPVFIGN